MLCSNCTESTLLTFFRSFDAQVGGQKLRDVTTLQPAYTSLQSLRLAGAHERRSFHTALPNIKNRSDVAKSSSWAQGCQKEQRCRLRLGNEIRKREYEDYGASNAGRNGSRIESMQSGSSPQGADVKYSMSLDEMGKQKVLGDKNLERGYIKRSERPTSPRAALKRKPQIWTESKQGAWQRRARRAGDSEVGRPKSEASSRTKNAETMPPPREQWQIQKKALMEKFGTAGWQPRKKLSPDALEGIRALYAQNPQRFNTPALAEQFAVSPEAIRRILRSKWRPSDDEEEDRKKRWEKRGQKIWSQMSELGVKPPRKWRSAGAGERGGDLSSKLISSTSGSGDGAATTVSARRDGNISLAERIL